MLDRRAFALAVAAALAVGAGACGGGADEAPEVVVEQALGHVAKGDGVAFVRLLAPDASGGVKTDFQHERLAAWLASRAQRELALDGATLEGWDAPRRGPDVGETATVSTVVRFRVAGGDPPERPVPLQVALRRHGGRWRIRNVTVMPRPVWLAQLAERGELLDDGPPSDLEAVVARFRKPPDDMR